MPDFKLPCCRPKNNEFYIVLQAFSDETSNGQVSVSMSMNTCKITTCPINTYKSGTRSDGSFRCTRCPSNSVASVGGSSSSACQDCPLHREQLNDDSNWCDIVECQTLIVSHGGNSVPDKDIPRYIRLIKNKKMSLENLITNEFTLPEINKAIDLFRSGKAGRIILKIT